MLIATLAVWRVTYFVHAEDGPADVSRRLREIAGAGFFGRLLGCFYCLSLWTAAPFALAIGAGATETICLWLALSAGAIVIERVTEPADAPAAVIHDESEEDSDELLREKSPH